MSRNTKKTPFAQSSNFLSKLAPVSKAAEQAFRERINLKSTDSFAQSPSLVLPKNIRTIQDIGTHLYHPSLSLHKLLRLLGMSRSDLHRKLKAATGMSATEYIRYLRLQRAAQILIEHPERSVFCVALEVGFNDHSYFTKRFRELYGKCPANFRAAHQNLGHTS